MVPDRYLQTNRGNGNVVLQNFTMQGGRMQTNSTVEELPPETYSRRKCEFSWMRTWSQYYDWSLIKWKNVMLHSSFNSYGQFSIHPSQTLSMILEFRISLLWNHLQTFTSSALVKVGVTRINVRMFLWVRLYNSTEYWWGMAFLAEVMEFCTNDGILICQCKVHKLLNPWHWQGLGKSRVT